MSGSTSKITKPIVKKAKRRQVAVACQGCRAAKRGCDGQSPCKVCLKRGIECVWAADTRRHAHRKPTNTTTHSKAPKDQDAMLRGAVPAPSAIDAQFLGTNAANKIDDFFNKYGCVFFKYDAVKSARTSATAFIARSVSEDATSIGPIEAEATRIAGLAMAHDSDVLETAQAFLTQSFCYISQSIGLAGFFARIGHSIAQTLEARSPSAEIAHLKRQLSTQQKFTDADELMSSSWCDEVLQDEFVFVDSPERNATMIAILGSFGALLRHDKTLIPLFFSHDCGGDSSFIAHSQDSFRSLPLHVARRIDSVSQETARRLQPQFCAIGDTGRWCLTFMSRAVAALARFLAGDYVQVENIITELLHLKRPNDHEMGSVCPSMVRNINLLAVMAHALKREDLLKKTIDIMRPLATEFAIARMALDRLEAFILRVVPLQTPTGQGVAQAIVGESIDLRRGLDLLDHMAAQTASELDESSPRSMAESHCSYKTAATSIGARHQGQANHHANHHDDIPRREAPTLDLFDDVMDPHCGMKEVMYADQTYSTGSAVFNVPTFNEHDDDILIGLRETDTVVSPSGAWNMMSTLPWDIDTAPRSQTYQVAMPAMAAGFTAAINGSMSASHGSKDCPSDEQIPWQVGQSRSSWMTT